MRNKHWDILVDIDEAAQGRHVVDKELLISVEVESQLKLNGADEAFALLLVVESLLHDGFEDRGH